MYSFSFLHKENNLAFAWDDLVFSKF